MGYCICESTNAITTSAIAVARDNLPSFTPMISCFVSFDIRYVRRVLLNTFFLMENYLWNYDSALKFY